MLDICQALIFWPMKPIAAMVLLLGITGARCRPAALPAAKSETAMPQPVERASAEDCALIVEIGKAKMNWGATPPEFAFYPEFDGAEGGTCLEDCPWKDLGVADPLIGTPTSEKAFFISRPVYSGMHASVDIEKSISPNQRIDGKRIAPFILRD
jgi:hypothetical protein